MITSKRKLTETEMEEQNLEYDGWGKSPNGKKEYYYVEKTYNYWRRDNMMRGRRPGRGMGRGRNQDESSGRMDSSQYGYTRGGRGRNRTDECRHPEKKKER